MQIETHFLLPDSAEIFSPPTFRPPSSPPQVNNTYVAPTGGGGPNSTLIASAIKVGAWEPFTMQYLAELKSTLDDIQYQDMDLSSKATPQVAWEASIDNPSDAEITHTISRTIRKSSTFEFLFSQTLGVGASAEFKASIPLIGSAKTTLSVELSFTAEQTFSKTEEEEYQFTDSVVIPKDSSVSIKGLLYWLDNVTVPYVATFIISAKDLNQRPLTNQELEKFLYQKGFTGKIKDSTSRVNELVVTLDGHLIGSWGTKASIQAERRSQ